MIGRIAIDTVVRLRWMYVFLAVILMPLMPILGRGLGALPLGMVLMLTATGAFAAMSQLPPNTFLLPIARHDVWRAQWVVAVLPLPLVTLVAWCAASLVAWLLPRMSLPDWSTLSLVAAYQIGWSGLALAALAFLGRPRRSADRRWSSLADNLAMLALLGSFFIGFFLARYLPLTWAELDALTGTALAVAIAGAAMTLLIVPATVPRPGMRAVPPAPRASRANRRPRWEGPTGLGRLVGRECLLVGLVSAVAYVVLRMVEPESYRGDNSLWLGMGFSFALSNFGLRSLARSLRVLPISSAQLTAILTTLPLTRWAVMVTVLLAVSWLATGRAESFSSLVLAFAGASVLTDAFIWRYGNNWGVLGAMLAFGGFFALARQLGARLDAPSGMVATGICLATILIAIMINYRTVVGSADAFKPRPLPFQG